MQIPASYRRFLRNFASPSKNPPSWLWLNVSNPAQQVIQLRGMATLIQTTETGALTQIVAAIPSGGHLATSRSSWVSGLVRALLGSTAKPEDHLVLPIHHKASLIGCLGWDKCANPNVDPTESLAELRQGFRTAWDLEMASSECFGLRWILSKCNRVTAVARPSGHIVATSATASELINSLQFGSRHYLREGATELPSRLIDSLKAGFSGQVKLTQNCTARFERLNLTTCCQPLIGIEFFVESLRIPPTISSLTPVEREIHGLVLEGKSNREIAEHRNTSFSTAKNQVYAVMSKMEVTRRHHLMIQRTGDLAPPAQLSRPGVKGVTISR